MDFGVLSKYDDLLASYFADSLYLWFKTIRMNNDFKYVEIEQSMFVEIIRTHLLSSTTPIEAIKQASNQVLEIPFFQSYIADFTKKQVSEFVQHMRRYLYMYLPTAGFELSSTTRYTGQMEACIVATRDWKAGEHVKWCVGSIAELSEEDDLKLKREGRDFSVMFSFKKKCFCLFLGPARFMNHDCEANCSFILIGQNAVTFRVERDIACGEEMTVYYADHYFGENNCECRCTSCEKSKQGGFSIEKDTSNSPDPIDSLDNSTLDDGSMIRRSGRVKKEISYKDYFLAPNNRKSMKSYEEALEIIPEPEQDPFIDMTHQFSKINLNGFDFLTKRTFQADAFQEWVENQSDLSDDDKTVVTCCDKAREFSLVKLSDEYVLCARCYRHYRIFGMTWPDRKPQRYHWKAKPTSKRIPDDIKRVQKTSGDLKPPTQDRVEFRTISSLASEEPVVIKEHVHVQRELQRLGETVLDDHAIDVILGATPGVRTRGMRETQEELDEWVWVDYHPRSGLKKPKKTDRKKPIQEKKKKSQEVDEHGQLLDLNVTPEELEQETELETSLVQVPLEIISFSLEDLQAVELEKEGMADKKKRGGRSAGRKKIKSREDSVLAQVEPLMEPPEAEPPLELNAQEVQMIKTPLKKRKIKAKAEPSQEVDQTLESKEVVKKRKVRQKKSPVKKPEEIKKDDEMTEAGKSTIQESEELKKDDEMTEAGKSTIQESEGLKKDDEMIETEKIKIQKTTEARKKMVQKTTETGKKMVQKTTEARKKMVQKTTETGKKMVQKTTETGKNTIQKSKELKKDNQTIEARDNMLQKEEEYIDIEKIDSPEIVEPIKKSRKRKIKKEENTVYGNEYNRLMVELRKVQIREAVMNRLKFQPKNTIKRRERLQEELKELEKNRNKIQTIEDLKRFKTEKSMKTLEGKKRKRKKTIEIKDKSIESLKVKSKEEGYIPQGEKKERFDENKMNYGKVVIYKVSDDYMSGEDEDDYETLVVTTPLHSIPSFTNLTIPMSQHFEERYLAIQASSIYSGNEKPTFKKRRMIKEVDTQTTEIIEPKVIIKSKSNSLT